MNNYETVFILTPVLSDGQMKEAVEKVKAILTQEGAEIINEENWGLKNSFRIKNIIKSLTKISIQSVRPSVISRNPSR